MAKHVSSVGCLRARCESLIRRGLALKAVLLAVVLVTLGVASVPGAAYATPRLGGVAVVPAGGDSGPGHAWVAPTKDNWAGHGLDPLNPAGCDPIDPSQCMLPYPNDWFTRPDPTSATGRRLDLRLAGMPRNVAGKPIEPAQWNRSDGFSAGAQILTVVPGMTSNADLAPSLLPSVTDLAENSDPNAGVVLLDTKTGQRWPVQTEIDQYTQESGLAPESTSAVQQDLVIHPATNLTDATRYIVALRHLVTDNGQAAQPSAAFLAYRDGTAPQSDPRRAHMESLFKTLDQAGVSRSSLYLAWDFTTASTQNVTGRLLAIRNNAFAQLGDTNLANHKIQGKAPAFRVDSITNYTPAQNSLVARRVMGHFTVPCYIAPTCAPPVKCATLTDSTPLSGTPLSGTPLNAAPLGGILDDCPSPGQFALGPNPDAVPHQVAGQTYQANFICNAGRGAIDHPGTKLRPVEYGHGLFGSAAEVNSGPQVTMAGHFNMMYCATDWFGMATADVANALLALSDVSNFPFITDRVQQGELNFLYLARLMVHPQGLGSNPAFQVNGKSFIDTSGVYYDGNSQGGIYGGTVCAVSVDVKHCILGVPGMNYSILLPRSADYVATKALSSFDPTQFSPADPTGQIGYSQVFDTFYPDQSQRMLIFDLIQTLWDRSDPDGYATHMTGGLPDTPHHVVLMQMAWGDHQVANITAEAEARTIGAAVVSPPLVTGRYGPYLDPFWGITPITNFPYHGSALTVFDGGPSSFLGGTDPPPPADVPNRSGSDPHEYPRNTAAGQQQKSDFMKVNGLVTSPGPGAPFFSNGWNGTSGL